MPTSVHGFSRRPAASLMAATVLLCLAGLAQAQATRAGAVARDSIPASPLPSLGNKALPIDLDASYSEFDRRNNRLVFRQLTITQGTLAIKADEATANPADFEHSVWVFTGNVQIQSDMTRATGSRAQLKFRDNRLLVAQLSGDPASFSQPATAGHAATEGHAQHLDYDLSAGTIELTTDAFLSDGKNEIAGNRIAYDLKREVVTAGAENGGQVRMRFTPKGNPVIPEKAPGKTTPEKSPRVAP